VTALLLTIALVLDALLGEPEPIWRRVPHPAVVMGRLVAALDRSMNRGAARRAKGAAAVALLVGGGWLAGVAIESAPLVGPVLSTVLAAIMLAQKSLADHVVAVADALDRDLPEGRRAVAMIVGRDVEPLDEPGVARAAIESCAENFSDGVVAPAFWFLVAGAPGILVYKIVNTADSMIGHRTPRHEQFGWAAARLDDALNLIPARLSALMLIVASWSRAALTVTAADARRHRSPNAGWPEAAVAGALGVALSGPRVYAGRLSSEAWVNPSGRRDAGAGDIRRAVALIWLAWALGLAATAVLATLQAA
jgi:adenosylcobinamide-phosphate synthase